MKQRMLRGDEYMATDEQLTAERDRCSALCEQINALPAAQEPARMALFRELLGAIGDDTLIQSPFRCDYGYNIRIGRRSFINYGGHRARRRASYDRRRGAHRDERPDPDCDPSA